jgi:hypothetical protein
MAGGLAEEAGGVAGEEFAAAAGHEDARAHGDAQVAELRPAEDVFERQAGDSPVHQGGEVGGCPCCVDEQLRLLFGEDAAGAPKAVGDRRS